MVKIRLLFRKLARSRVMQLLHKIWNGCIIQVTNYLKGFLQQCCLNTSTILRYFLDKIRRLAIWFRVKISDFFRCFLPILRSNISNLAIFLFVGLIAVGYLCPRSIPLEGNIITDQVAFTCKQTECPLLHKVQIDSITITGEQEYTFNGSKGEFNNPGEAQLKDIEDLIIKTEDEESSLTIETISKESSMELAELVLQEDTQVEQLLYSPERTFKLKLNQVNTSSNTASQSSNSYRPLRLNTGNVVQVTCKGKCILPQLKAKERDNFRFKKATIDFQPLLPLSPFFDIKFHTSDKEPFFGNTAVGNVLLTKTQRRLGESGYVKSSILGGTVRMSGQSIDLKKDQFLLLGSQSVEQALTDGLEDITTFRYIRVVFPGEDKELQISGEKVQLSESTPGLEIGISGETSRLEIGINPHLPIKTIQGNFFSKLPTDMMNFLNLLFAAVFGGFVTWLFDKLPKKNIP
jgi:hypothetical protein